MDFITPIVTPAEIADAQRYGSDEHETIKRYIMGSQSLLFKAGAFNPEDPLTGTAVEMIVGHWLENRDLMGYDFKSIESLPIALTAVINALRFSYYEPTEEEIKVADNILNDLSESESVNDKETLETTETISEPPSDRGSDN